MGGIRIVDSNGYTWAAQMKKLLQETCATVSGRNRKQLTAKEYAVVQKRHRSILTRGEKVIARHSRA